MKEKYPASLSVNPVPDWIIVAVQPRCRAVPERKDEEKGTERPPPKKGKTCKTRACYEVNKRERNPKVPALQTTVGWGRTPKGDKRLLAKCAAWCRRFWARGISPPVVVRRYISLLTARLEKARALEALFGPFVPDPSGPGPSSMPQGNIEYGPGPSIIRDAVVIPERGRTTWRPPKMPKGGKKKTRVPEGKPYGSRVSRSEKEKTAELAAWFRQSGYGRVEPEIRLTGGRRVLARGPPSPRTLARIRKFREGRG